MYTYTRKVNPKAKIELQIKNPKIRVYKTSKIIKFKTPKNSGL